jgi:hypothetical protein
MHESISPVTTNLQRACVGDELRIMIFLPRLRSFASLPSPHSLSLNSPLPSSSQIPALRVSLTLSFLSVFSRKDPYFGEDMIEVRVRVPNQQRVCAMGMASRYNPPEYFNLWWFQALSPFPRSHAIYILVSFDLQYSFVMMIRQIRTWPAWSCSSLPPCNNLICMIIQLLDLLWTSPFVWFQYTHWVAWVFYPQVMRQISNQSLVPEKRPEIPPGCPPLVQALMQVRGEMQLREMVFKKGSITF